MTNSKDIKEKIEKEIVFLSDHWTMDDKKPFHFGGWKGEVVDALYKIFEQELASQNKELREKIEGIKVPWDWNQGHKTERRYSDILNRNGTMMDLYNQALDDVLSLLKFDGDINATYKSTEETHYSCMRMLMKRNLGCCKCDDHECRVWEEK